MNRRRPRAPDGAVRAAHAKSFGLLKAELEILADVHRGTRLIGRKAVRSPQGADPAH